MTGAPIERVYFWGGMMATLALLATLAVTISIVLFVWFVLLRLGLYWGKVPDVTLGRLVRACLLRLVVSMVSLVLIYFLGGESRMALLALTLIELGATGVIVMLVFHTTVAQAFKAWLPTLGTVVLAFLFAHFVTRPYLFESYTQASNNMAPSLLGIHRLATCPECGSPSYCTVRDHDSGPQLMICDRFHTFESSDYGKEEYPAERWAACRFLSPQRWDIVVHRVAESPEVKFVNRVVGLPGEEIIIRDGKVWANGDELTIPPELEGIEYLSSFPEERWGNVPPLWGSEEQPAKLAKGEYFVLGDFSARSRDARLWHEGAPGHPPYAVPEEYIQGVATHRYWPLERWKAFR